MFVIKIQPINYFIFFVKKCLYNGTVYKSMIMITITYDWCFVFQFVHCISWESIDNIFDKSNYSNGLINFRSFLWYAYLLARICTPHKKTTHTFCTDNVSGVYIDDNNPVFLQQHCVTTEGNTAVWYILWYCFYKSWCLFV